MAGFKMHITVSTGVGICYGTAGYMAGLPLADCMLAGTLCSVSGMLPDLDSSSGVPVRETFAFLAATIPMMMASRLQTLGLPHELIIVVGIMAYIFVRFGVAEIFRKYTVHRGMWHSLPAAASCGIFAFLICQCNEMDLRIYRSMAVVAGFLSHLILDEIWSVEIRRGKLRLKKSFGTALKMWSTKDLWANISTYGKLIVLVGIAISDPMLMEEYGPPTPQDASADFTQSARSWWDEHVEGDRVLRR